MGEGDGTGGQGQGQGNEGVVNFHEIIGEDGTLAPNWNAHFPDFATDKTLAEVKDFPGAMKMLVNAQKLVGADKIVLPPKDAPKEKWDEVYGKLGFVNKPEAYNFTKPENLPEGLEYNETMANAFKQIASEGYVKPEVATKIHDFYVAMRVEEAKAMEEQKKEKIATIVNSLGKDKEQLMMKGMKFLNRILPDDAEKELILGDWMGNGGGLGNNPALIKVLARCADLIDSDKLINFGSGMGNIDAASELNKIMSDTKGAFYDRTHPQHKETMQKVEALNKIIHGDKRDVL